MSPAMNGLRLWMINTFATDVRCSAMMKQVEAIAKHTAIPTPAAPMSAKTAAVPRPSRSEVTASRNAAQKSPRQNTVVQGSVSALRASRPPRLQNTAAAATSSRPRARSAGAIIGRGSEAGETKCRSPGQGRGFAAQRQAITMEARSWPIVSG